MNSTVFFEEAGNVITTYDLGKIINFSCKPARLARTRPAMRARRGGRGGRRGTPRRKELKVNLSAFAALFDAF
jgi:hypothetical protein